MAPELRIHLTDPKNFCTVPSLYGTERFWKVSAELVKSCKSYIDNGQTDGPGETISWSFGPSAAKIPKNSWCIGSLHGAAHFYQVSARLAKPC